MATLMQATLILMHEHQQILKRLKDLEDLLERDGNLLASEVTPYIDFIEIYADQFHHEKEEKIYFQWMQQQDPELQNGPIGCMLKEHDLGRRLIKATKECLNLKEMAQAKEFLMAFVELLRSHIEKEDFMLYPMAEQLGKEGDVAMLGQFESVRMQFLPTLQKLGIAKIDPVEFQLQQD